jgi:RES domain-containing protein
MRCWRIYHRRFTDARSGEGARRYGGRWNPKGVPALYLACSPALALAEKLVQAPSVQQSDDFLAAEFEIGARHVPGIAVDQLPTDWDAEPYTSASQDFGYRQFREHGRLGFRIPSVVVPIEYNAVIDPEHPHFSVQVRLIREAIPFPFDKRLLRKR